MTSEVHEVVGEEKIGEVCRKYKLTQEDRNAIDKILEEWEYLVGEIDQKNRVAFNIIGSNPRRARIIHALRDINIIFMLEKMKKRSMN